MRGWGSQYLKYRWRAGMWAFVLHRVTGVALALYLLVHIWVTRNLGKGPETFEAMMKTFNTPLVKVLEAGLLGLVLIHGLNGVRLIISDMGVPSAAQRPLFWGVVVMGLLLLVVGGYPIVAGGLG